MRGYYEPLNNRLTDFRTAQAPLSPTGEIAIIAIDPRSLRDIGTWPWSRSIHGEILDRLLQLDAGVVFYDIDFAFLLIKPATSLSQTR